MKVLLINCSPHAHGCTYTALKEVADTLELCGVDTEILQTGSAPIQPCTACRGCRQTNRCVYDDVANVILDKMQHMDGMVIGSPVHYASPSGTAVTLMDRVFYAGGSTLHHKPGAAIVSARRAGTTAALDVLNKYILYAQMPLVTSRYWNMVHGNTAEEVKQDLEGMQIMRVLGRNMAWLLKCIEAGKQAGIPYPEAEAPVHTNFIR